MKSPVQSQPGNDKFERRRPYLVRGKFEDKAFLIPSFVTVVGIFCGFLGLMAGFHGDFRYAARCIAIAFVLDGLDGRIARRLNATSEFGREFDSLSDVIAFGVAPAVLVYMWAFKSTADEFGLLISYLFVVCGATRLARFNVMTVSEPTKHFVGLPIPAAAGAIISLVNLSPSVVESHVVVAFLLLYTAAIALLMVSKLPYLSVKHLHLTRTTAPLHLVLVSALVALVWYNSGVAFVVLAGGYVLSAPIFLFTQKRYPHLLERVKDFAGIRFGNRKP